MFIWLDGFLLSLAIFLRFFEFLLDLFLPDFDNEVTLVFAADEQALYDKRLSDVEFLWGGLPINFFPDAS